MDEGDLRNRYRRDYTRELISTAPPKRSPSPQPTPEVIPEEQPVQIPKAGRNRKYKKLIFILLAFLILIGLASVGGWYYVTRTKSPVPANISKSVPFPVYYPDQKKLPAGYVLDTKSFSTGQGAVIYNVNFDNKKLFFAVQKKPSDSQIQGFYAKALPLHSDTLLPIGTAAVGALNNSGQLRSLVSIPTKTNAWILIIGPPDVNQDQLKQVLQAIKD